ncbi:MAG: DUF362 domain-containing protein [Clostridia bacterium]
MIDFQIVKVRSYNQTEVDNGIDTLLKLLGGIEKYIKPNMKVFIKANLVREMTPDKAATTHPAIIEALCKKIKEIGAQVIVGDSSSGVYNLAYMTAIYKTTGMDIACKNSGALLNEDFSSSVIFNENSAVLKNAQLTNSFLTADVVINVCKLKTHGLTGYSGAVKNLYGLIPGLVKIEMHSKFNTLDTLCNCLVDIARIASEKIKLHIIDGIIGMDGNGPTNGAPKKMDVLIASSNAYYADMAAISLFGDPLENPIIQTAINREIITEQKEEILALREDLKEYAALDFNAIDVKLATSGFKDMPKFIKALFRSSMSRKVSINKKICVGCGKCKLHCPGKAIEIKNKKAHINQNKCIRCYCCQELCPKNAVKYNKPILYGIVHKLSERKN